MKVVILAGGFGTRISEETDCKPKPMIEIGGYPILWHIMKIYAQHGLTDFVICCGYKGHLVKQYFADYALHQSDVTFDLKTGRMEVHQNASEPWRVTLVDTGLNTMTGGRLKRVARYLGEEDFCFTYGDGVADIDITRLIAFHRGKKTLATVTAVQPPARFGALQIEAGMVTRFTEKPLGEGGWISGGFFVLNPRVVDYVEGDDTHWERAPLEKLASEGNLSVYTHPGFFQPLDTLRDKQLLARLWESGEAPWKVWR